jgi:hypothetical protein
MELENTVTSHIYWIFSGEILIYKQINIDCQTQIQEDDDLSKEVLSISGVQPLEMFYNPIQKNKGTRKSIGLCIGAFRGSNIVVGEDSALFKKQLVYTMVAKKGLVVFKYPTKSA